MTALEYIFARIRVEDRGHGSPCWIWQRWLTEKGYGRGDIPGMGRKRIHRATYELVIGPIPEGLTIDHLCCVKSCCNPTHLEAVEAIENYRRALPRIAQSLKTSRPHTHCKRGHELTPENSLSQGATGRRRCRICYRDYVKKWAAARNRAGGGAVIDGQRPFAQDKQRSDHCEAGF